MARKRKKIKDYKSQEYWDKLLLDYDLTMEKGRNCRVSYVGDSSVLARIAGEQETATGRVGPKPQME